MKSLVERSPEKRGVHREVREGGIPPGQWKKQGNKCRPALNWHTQGCWSSWARLIPAMKLRASKRWSFLLQVPGNQLYLSIWEFKEVQRPYKEGAVVSIQEIWRWCHYKWTLVAEHRFNSDIKSWGTANKGEKRIKVGVMDGTQAAQ